MHFLLHLLSAVALLAYGVSVTKTAMLRTCGASLSAVVHNRLGSRITAATAGLGITMLVQSSTATSLLVSSFLQQGILPLGTALAIMLGADLGTAVMARILTLDLSLLCPLLMTVGTALYLISKERPQFRNTGGIILGLGLILLALQLVVEATEPVIESDLTAMLLSSLTGQLTFSVLLGTVLAVICYSSLAAVLLTSLLSASGSIEPQCALAVVVGSNLGSCVLEILGALRQGVEARRVMLGNTLFKTVIAAFCLPLLPYIVLLQHDNILDLAQFVIWFHVVFNAAVCFGMLPCVNWCSRFLLWMIPERQMPPDPDRPKHLDQKSYVDPALALGNAMREILSVGDFLQQMMQIVDSRIQLKDVTGEDDAELYQRIRGITPQINDFISGINCDTGKQRLRMRQCILAVMGLSQGAKLVRNIGRAVSNLNSSSPDTFTSGRREELLKISRQCRRTIELALNAFMNRGKKLQRNYAASRDDFLRLSASYGSGKLMLKHGETKAESRYNVDMLGIIERYRQLCVVFDQIFVIPQAGEGEEITHD